MTRRELQNYGIPKQASWLDGFNKIFGKGTDLAEKGAGAAVENAKTALAVGLPGSLAILAWLAYKATSPEAVASNASEYAINAMEKESLVQSMRDAEDAKVRKRLSGNRKRVHDQFL
jgi:hypothetical protein